MFWKEWRLLLWRSRGDLFASCCCKIFVPSVSVSWGSCSSGCLRHLATFCFSPFPWTRQYLRLVLLKLFRHDCHFGFRSECICVLYQPTRFGFIFSASPLWQGPGNVWKEGKGTFVFCRADNRNPTAWFQKGIFTPFFIKHSDIWG